ncbi:MAG: hypothetical protein CFE45_18650 [Burkholderiales bacterium PBB5]|nr:MAG: hypothetical protein CFE45_18650 [Burkholderiales bacterium PBB5]
MTPTKALSPELLQTCLDIRHRTDRLNLAGGPGAHRVALLNPEALLHAVGEQPDGTYDDPTWATLSLQRQQELAVQLAEMLKMLIDAAAADGPSDPHHIMSAAYASNGQILVWVLVGLVMVVQLLFVIGGRWEEATGADRGVLMANSTVALNNAKTSQLALEKALSAFAAEPGDATLRQEFSKAKGGVEAAHAAFEATKSLLDAATVNEAKVLQMVALLGGLGGALHYLTSLVAYVGNRQLRRSWLAYYLASPVLGAGLAPAVYLLVRLGVLNPSGGNTAANLNLFGIYAFAVLTGLFSRVALDKLSEVFGTMFRTDTGKKDSLGGEDGKGGTAGKD